MFIFLFKSPPLSLRKNAAVVHCMIQTYVRALLTLSVSSLRPAALLVLNNICRPPAGLFREIANDHYKLLQCDVPRPDDFSDPECVNAYAGSIFPSVFLSRTLLNIVLILISRSFRPLTSRSRCAFALCRILFRFWYRNNILFNTTRFNGKQNVVLCLNWRKNNYV